MLEEPVKYSNYKHSHFGFWNVLEYSKPLRWQVEKVDLRVLMIVLKNKRGYINRLNGDGSLPE